MTGIVEQQQPSTTTTTTTQRISPKKSSSLWKRFMKKSSNSNSNNNNNNAASSSSKSVSTPTSSSAAGAASSSSVGTAGQQQQQQTTTQLGPSSQNSVVADITPTGELSFFEAFSNFEDQSSPTSVRNLYPQDYNNNSPTTEAKRSRSGYSRASTVEVGSSTAVTPSRGSGGQASSSSHGANNTPAATSSTLGAITTVTSSPKSATPNSKDQGGGGGTVCNGTVAEKSVHTMKSKGSTSKNTSSTVSLTATYNNDASTMDFSKPTQYSSHTQAAAQDQEEGGGNNETQTTPTRTVEEEEDLLVPDWTAFQATSNFGIEQEQETNKKGTLATSTTNKKGNDDWNDQLPTTRSKSELAHRQVVVSSNNEIVNHVIPEESNPSTTESTGTEMEDDVLLEIKETSYIAPSSQHPTESSPPTRNVDKQSAVAAMMTTSMAQAAAQAPSTSTSSRSNSMRKAAGSKLGRKSKNRGSSLKKRGSDIGKRVSSSEQQEKQAENPIAMAAAKTNKKSANTVTTAIGPSAQQQHTSDVKKSYNKTSSLPSPTSLSPSSKSKKKMLNTSAASGGGAPQPHLYAEISVPTKRTRKHHSSSSSPSSKSPLSSPSGTSGVNVSRQSSTKSHGTNGEADVSLALTSISSLTGRSSLFGNMPLSPSSTGIWCQDEELNATNVVGTATSNNNAEEEDYFDYSPNIHENPTNTVNSNDEGIITRLMCALSDALTCRCFDGMSGAQLVGGQQEGGGGDNATAAAPSGKSVMSGGMGATLETVMNDTAATIANTMMSTNKTQGVGSSSKAPTFSDPMEEI